MEWTTWRDACISRVGQVTEEMAKQFVIELCLSRKVALSSSDAAKSCSDIYTPTSVDCISRTRRVMQTLGAIMMSSDLDNYYQAVYLLEFLHGLYPNVISVQQYSQLLVYLKSQAVIYVACCSTVSDRTQAARCLIRQLFDSYSCGSADHNDKMVLENAHKLGSAELKKILSNGKKLSLAGISVQPLTRELYNKMCGILKEFLEGIDNKLPLPTIVQLINNHLKKDDITYESESQDRSPKKQNSEHSSRHQTEDLTSGSNLHISYVDYLDVGSSEKDSCQPVTRSTEPGRGQPKASMLSRGRGRKKAQATVNPKGYKASLRAKAKRCN